MSFFKESNACTIWRHWFLCFLWMAGWYHIEVDNKFSWRRCFISWGRTIESGELQDEVLAVWLSEQSLTLYKTFASLINFAVCNSTLSILVCTVLFSFYIRQLLRKRVIIGGGMSTVFLLWSWSCFGSLTCESILVIVEKMVIDLSTRHCETNAVYNLLRRVKCCMQCGVHWRDTAVPIESQNSGPLLRVLYAGTYICRRQRSSTGKLHWVCTETWTHSKEIRKPLKRMFFDQESS